MRDFAALVPAKGAALAELRENILESDFPHWFTSRSNDDRLAEMVSVMRAENARAQAEREAQRASDRAPILPSSKFPFAVDRYKLITGEDDEEDLPILYTALANATKQ